MSGLETGAANFLFLVDAPEVEWARALDLPVAVLGLHQADGRFSLHDGQREVDLRAAASLVIGGAAASPAARATFAAFGEAWATETGQPPPALIDLADTPDPVARRLALLAGIARLLQDRLAQAMHHNAQLLTSMSRLRVTHEETRLSVQTLGSFIAQDARLHRVPVDTFGPLETSPQAGFRLTDGNAIHQRLAVGSSGTCDIAVFLPEQEFPASGQATVRLDLLESGDEIAVWNRDAADLGPGWWRMSLPAALGEDEQTMRMTARWQGEGALRIGAGLRHPDPRFCADLGGTPQGQILAHRVWKFLPGAAAPLPSDGQVAMMPRTGRVYVSTGHLAQATPLDPENECVKFLEKRKAVQVHPRRTGVSGARLMDIVAPGTRSIEATIGAIAYHCPPIEYALAVAPRHPLLPSGELLSRCAAAGALSDWVMLSGDQKGDLRLLLAAPARHTLDLFLLTRAAEGVRPSFGWATFGDIWMAP